MQRTVPFLKELVKISYLSCVDISWANCREVGNRLTRALEGV